jgi:hypothetical protein
VLYEVLKAKKIKEMQRVVCHMSKAKSGSSGGLTPHIDRTNEQEQANVHENKSHLNFKLVEEKGTIDDMIKHRINEGYKGKKAVRKDAVTSCRYILSGSHERMSEIGKSPLKIREWAKDNYDYFADKYGEENIVRATVHMDEKTPHMHLIVVPITPDGRLAAKHFTGSTKKLRDLQTDYAEGIGKKWGFGRGLENSPRKHIESKDFYKYLEGKDISAEWVLNNPNAKDIISVLLQENDKIKELQAEKIKQVEQNRTKNLNNKKTSNNVNERAVSKGNEGSKRERSQGNSNSQGPSL